MPQLPSPYAGSVLGPLEFIQNPPDSPVKEGTDEEDIASLGDLPTGDGQQADDEFLWGKPRRESLYTTPRTKYNNRSRARMDEAPNLVNYLDMSALKEHFQSHKGVIDLTTFICIMHKGLQSRANSRQGARRKGNKKGDCLQLPQLPPVESYGMTARLAELFREIDLDGDGYIVWGEFTRHIVDKAAVNPAAARQEVILPYYHQHNIDPSSRYRHKEFLDRILAVPRKEYIAAIEERSPVITFYNTKTGSVVKSLKCKAPPMGMTYVGDPERLLVTANADMTMVTWNLDDGPIKTRWMEKSKWPTPSPQISLCWVPSQQLLYSGG